MKTSLNIEYSIPRSRRINIHLLKHAVLVSIFFVAFASFPLSAAPKELTLAVGLAIPPYNIPETKSGIELDIVREALKDRGYTIKPKYVPFARVKKELKDQTVDGALTINPDSGIEAFYSDEHLICENVVISLKENRFNIKEVNGLKGKSILAFQDATLYLGKDFASMAKENNKYRELPKQKIQINLLYSNRVDTIVLDENIFYYHRQRNDMVDISQAIDIWHIFSPTPFSVAFVDEEVRNDFNEGLKKLRKTGRYDEIVKKYIVDQAVNGSRLQLKDQIIRLRGIVMRNWSIVTRIVASACGIVCTLVLLGGFVLIKFEIRMIDSFTKEILSGIHHFIDDRAEEEKKSLREDVKFNAEILSGIGATYLYNLDQDGLKNSLRPYMNYPEIVAISVLDDKGTAFAAAWRNDSIKTGDVLPKDLKLNDSLSVSVDCMQEGKKIGNFQVYYIDTLLKKKIKTLKKEASDKSESFENASRSELNRAIASQTIGVFVILLALVVSLIFLLRALVLKPLNDVSKIALKLSDFDLTVGIDATRKDEIGTLLKAIDGMAASFRKVVGQVQRSGIQVTSSSTELAATAKEQEATVANQVESTNRVVKSVEQISEVATELVDTMEQVASKSQETAGFASKGQTDLARMEEAMGSMEAASKSISGRLEAINEKAENITNVVTTITKVADQTNLLSLNAAIEAEKAGEYGRGFNVVAREIRRLADQTAVATLDIDQMVQEMQSAVSAGVMEMDKFIAEVNRSAEDVGRISVQLARIIEQVQALSPSFENVNVSMGQQSENAQKINFSMANLSEEMQQTMDSLRETYGAIEQLNEAARGLQDEVSRFKVE